MSSLSTNSSLSDEMIRRFLLGGLMTIEQTVFEERLLVDDELAGRVRLMEMDLTDDYAFARLSDPDRKRFEERFLLSIDRERTLHVSTALRDRFARPNGARLPIGERLRLGFDLRRPVWRYALLSLALILFIATVWLVTKEPRIARRLLPMHGPDKSSSPSPSQLTHHPVNSGSVPNHQESSQSMPIHEASPAGIILRGNDEGPVIELSHNPGEVLKVQLILAVVQTGQYEVDVMTLDGQPVFKAEGLRPADSETKIDFELPVGLLRAGSYQIRLSLYDDQSKQGAMIYYFRVG